jgi:hypothetical protein
LQRCSNLTTSSRVAGMPFTITSVTRPFRLLNILYCAEAGSIAKHKTTEAARQARVIKGGHDRVLLVRFLLAVRKWPRRSDFHVKRVTSTCDARHKMSVSRNAIMKWTGGGNLPCNRHSCDRKHTGPHVCELLHTRKGLL